jgi:ABC-2 type transport system ATP-binding protein
MEVIDLCKNYGGKVAVQGLSFTVERGTVTGFLGPNGAGKSTTMRILTGLASATSGKARIMGHCVATHPERVQQQIGYMAENNPLVEEMRVGEYLRYRASLKGLGGSRLSRRVAEAMALCDLDKKARNKLIRTLSKGFRQRVGIADCVLAEPPVILMDEPTIGLDPHQILAMRALLRSLAGRMTVVISSHILPEIEACCDQVIILNHGRVVASGAPEDLKREFVPNSQIRLSTNAPASQLTGLIKPLGYSLQPRTEVPLASVPPEPGGFSEHLLQATDAASPLERLTQAVVTAGHQVRTLAPVPATLENVFLAATEKSWQQTTSTANPLPDHAVSEATEA